jgi:pimeloyl-ACP methyl ester carboxylesterase
MQHATSRDGTVIGYARSGTGPPLLLVHGTTADHTRWAPITPRLAQHFTVYAMDRRGRGESGDAPDYNLTREAEDVAAVAEAAGEPVFALGHSHGALCCLEASLLTDQISKLVLYEPPIPTGLPFGPPDVLDRMQALIDEGDLEAALELFMREVVKMPEHELAQYRKLPAWQKRIRIMPTVPREEQLLAAYRFEPERFANMRTPTLLLLGGDSPEIFRNGTAALDAALPNSRIAVMPGQQHIAMDMDPDLFLREVLDFLS